MHANPGERRPRRQLTLPLLSPRELENRRRHMSYQLDALEMEALLASRRGLHNNTMLRAMGIAVPAPLYNPGGKRMARRRRRRNPSRAARLRALQRKAGQLPLFRRRRAGGGGGGGGSHRPRMLRPRPAPRGFVSASPVRGLLGPVPAVGGGALAVYTPPGSMTSTRRPRRRRRAAPRRLTRFSVARARRGASRPTSGVVYPDAIFSPGGRRKRRKGAGAGVVTGTFTAPGTKKRRKRKPAQQHAAPTTTRKRRKPRPATQAARRPASKPKVRRHRRGFPAISASATYSGRAKYPRGFRSRRRAAARRRAAGHKNLKAVRIIRKGQKIAGLVRRRNNPARGGSTMARHAHRRRRRRNPALNIKGVIKSLLSIGLPAVAGGAVVSLIDNKLLAGKSKALRYAGKLGAAVGVSLLLKSKPQMAAAAMAGILSGIGYDLGTQIGGPASTISQIAYLVSADRQAMSALIDASGAPQTVPSLNGMGQAMSGPNDVVLG